MDQHDAFGESPGGCRLHPDGAEGRCLGCLIRSVVDLNWLEGIERVRKELQEESLPESFPSLRPEVGALPDTSPTTSMIDLRRSSGVGNVTRAAAARPLDDQRRDEPILAGLLERTTESSIVIRVVLEGLCDVKAMFGASAVERVIDDLCVRLSSQPSFEQVVRATDGSLICIAPVSSVRNASMLVRSTEELISQVVWIDGVPVSIRSRIGASIAQIHGNDAETLMGRAGMALESSLRQGKAVIWDPHTADATFQELLLRGAVADEIERDQFEFLFQPVICRNGRFDGAEILLRRTGTHASAEFVAMGGSGALARRFYSGVIRSGLSRWRKISPVSSQARISLTVRADFITREGSEEILSAILAVGAQPGHLHIGVDAREGCPDGQDFRTGIDMLRSIGVRVGLAYFGTGASNVDLVWRNTFDQVKVDRRFVRDLATDERDRDLLWSWASVLERRGVDLSVDGIENERMLHFAWECGATHVQGRAVSPPCGLDGLVAFARTRTVGSSDSVVRQP